MGFVEYLTQPGTIDALVEQGVDHVALTGAAVLTATVLGVLLGVIAHRVLWLRGPIMNVLSVLLTIPSLALIALLLPLVGIGFAPAYIALTMYALLPIGRNTLAGLRAVDPAMVESARGMGMSGLQRLWRMEMPVAWPIILTGIRVATLLVVGIAAVAALVGGEGFGEEIYLRGIRRIGSPGALEALLGGTLGVLVVALLFDLLYKLIGRFTISRGL
ncbi:MAG TPA: ABC transporter permease [Euzebyales bacterium]|nr:ABC transporter permease [Euzebyales bacterium]